MISLVVDFGWLADPSLRRVYGMIALFMAGWSITWRGWWFICYVPFLVFGAVVIP